MACVHKPDLPMLQHNRYITMTEPIGGIHTHMANQLYWAAFARSQAHLVDAFFWSQSDHHRMQHCLTEHYTVHASQGLYKLGLTSFCVAVD